MPLPVLKPHQKTTVEFGIQNPYSIIALDMGLGKSACALKIWERTGGNLLIVCPSYLVPNWQKEIRKFLGPEPIITTIRKGSEIYDLFDTDIAIISYDLAVKAENLFEWADSVVADEAHLLKTMTAIRTEAFHKYVYENSIKRLHLLTGTPIKNRVAEYYSLLALLNYRPGNAPPTDFLKKFPDPITFADYFSNRFEYKIPAWKRVGGKSVKWMMTVTKWEGLRNKDELKKYLKGFYIRFNSEDVLDLPPIVVKDVMIAETKDMKLLEAFDRWSTENSSVKPEFKRQAAVKKTPFTIRYVKDLLDEVQCVAIYTDHVESCEALAKAFGTRAAHGGMTAAARYKHAEDFQAGRFPVLCATIDALSVGVDLTRSSNIIFNDYPWVPGDIDQTIKRIVRITQQKRCTVHNIIGSPQDLYILNEVRKKAEVIGQVT